MGKRTSKPSGNQRPVKPQAAARQKLYQNAENAIAHIAQNSTSQQIQRRMRGVDKPTAPSSHQFGAGAAHQVKTTDAARKFVRNPSGTKQPNAPKPRNRSEAARKAAITRKAKGK